MRLSTLRFVQEAVNERKARHRLRDWLVLGLRTLAVLCLATAIARPLFGSSEETQAGEAADTIRIVILDVSQSMSAREGGVEHIERARSAAAEHFEWRQGLKANLILAAATPRSVFEGAASNFAVVRDELNELRVLPERLDAQAAIDAASDMLAGGGSNGDRGPTRELIIVSDFQRSNWASVDFSVLPEDTKIELSSVASTTAQPNIGLLEVGTVGRAEVGREVTIECAVGNYSPTLRRVQVEIEIGETSLNLEADCAANSRTTLSGQVLVSATGWQFGTARLVRNDDALPADDVRPWVMRVQTAPNYLLVTRQSSEQVPSSSFYLQEAIGSIGSARNENTVTRVRPDDLDQRIAATADIVVVDHPGPLSPKSISLLASLMRRGRAVLYVASESVDATNLLRLVEASAGGVRLPVEFQPPRKGRLRKDLFLAEMKTRRAPFSAFGDDLKSLTSELRFAGGLMSRNVEGQLADDVLASYADRTACLVTAAADAGALVVLNADLGRSDIVTAPIFVPMLDELTRAYLLTSRGRGMSNLCGEPMVVALPAEVDSLEGLEVQYRDVGTSEWSTSSDDRLQQESAGSVWSSGRSVGPAVGRVTRGDETLVATATVIPDVESDLRSLEADVFEERLSGGRDVQFAFTSGTETGERDTAWNWLLIGGVLCALGEFGVLRMFAI